MRKVEFLLNRDCKAGYGLDWPPVSSDREVPQRAAPAARLVNFAWKVTPV